MRSIGPRPFFLPALWISALAFLLVAPLAHAHSFEITKIDLRLHRDGTLEIDVPFHVDALLAQVPSGEPTEEDYTRLRERPTDEFEADLAKWGEYLRTGVRVKFDGVAIDLQISFPERDEARERGDASPLPGQRFRLHGEIPEGAQELLFTASPTFKLIMLSIWWDDFDAPRQEFVNAGEVSTPYDLTALEPQGRLSVIGQYLRLGFLHIVPGGLDHILFVLGLFLLSTRVRPLLWQVTAFTLAHTTTLALSTYGVLQLSSSIVEPLIALSIAYVGVENMLTTELKPWRPAVVFGFGLLHGLGFAGVLRELGLPQGRFVEALLSFNVGVEFGQIAILAGAFLLVGWFRKRVWYRARIVIPASGVITIVALYWTVTRWMG